MLYYMVHTVPSYQPSMVRGNKDRLANIYEHTVIDGGSSSSSGAGATVFREST